MKSSIFLHNFDAEQALSSTALLKKSTVSHTLISPTFHVRIS